MPLLYPPRTHHTHFNTSFSLIPKMKIGLCHSFLQNFLLAIYHLLGKSPTSQTWHTRPVITWLSLELCTYLSPETLKSQSCCYLRIMSLKILFFPPGMLSSHYFYIAMCLACFINSMESTEARVKLTWGRILKNKVGGRKQKIM